MNMKIRKKKRKDDADDVDVDDDDDDDDGGGGGGEGLVKHVHIKMSNRDFFHHFPQTTKNREARTDHMPRTITST